MQSLPQLAVDLYGHLGSSFGLGYGARSTKRLLEAVGVQVRPRHLALASHPADKDIDESDTLSPPLLDLVHTNPNILQQTHGLLDSRTLQAPLRVGYWAWELEAFPDGWEPAFGDYDEIWSPSSFCATALSQRSPIPVIAVPHLLDWVRLDRLTQSRANSRIKDAEAEPFRFLTLFDYWSTTERKNPAGVIRAFQRAFPTKARGPRVELIIKASGAEQFPHERAALHQLAGDDPRIHWVERLLSEAELDALWLRCDALVSLHRAEGFGLTIAEAMAIGLPVVCTAYSGNLDFCPANSTLAVGWRPTPIGSTTGDYPEGAVWAEPDGDDAVEALRTLVADPARGQGLGARGQAAVRQRLSVEALAPILRQRLGTLLLQPSRRQLLALSPESAPPG